MVSDWLQNLCKYKLIVCALKGVFCEFGRVCALNQTNFYVKTRVTY